MIAHLTQKQLGHIPRPSPKARAGIRNGVSSHVPPYEDSLRSFASTKTKKEFFVHGASISRGVDSPLDRYNEFVLSQTLNKLMAQGDFSKIEIFLESLIANGGTIDILETEQLGSWMRIWTLFPDGFRERRLDMYEHIRLRTDLPVSRGESIPSSFLPHLPDALTQRFKH